MIGDRLGREGEEKDLGWWGRIVRREEVVVVREKEGGSVGEGKGIGAAESGRVGSQGEKERDQWKMGVLNGELV